MDITLKLRAFVETAVSGSFSGAARTLNATPSAIMKRVNELEYDFGVSLFSRTTRLVRLTDEGDVYFRHAVDVLKSLEAMKGGGLLADGQLEGPIRVRSSTVSTEGRLGQLLVRYQMENPLIRLHVIADDSKADPGRDGFDAAIGIFPLSYDGVAEHLLHPYPRVTCASPAYLAKHGTPTHPRDLSQHQCATYLWVGTLWEFRKDGESIGIDVQPVSTTNSPIYLRQAALEGLCIVQLSRLAARAELRRGTLVEVLPEFKLDQYWMKILIPEARLQIARVKHFRDYVRSAVGTDHA